MKLYFSIDLESWAYPNDPRFLKLDSTTRKKVDNGFILESINKILDLLARYGQQITFFSLGEIFEWYPKAFEKIKKAGHEIAYHTHRHARVTDSETIKKEILASRNFLNEFRPVGFRAPQIYLPKDALAPLIEAGFRYDSSVYGSQADIFNGGKGELMELPVSTFLYGAQKLRALDYPRPLGLSMLANEMPFGSGYFFALLPPLIIERMIDIYRKMQKPVFMFVHNWQITPPADASFPSLKYKFTHPTYLPYTVPVKNKLTYFLKNYSIGRMDEFAGIKKLLEQENN
jgi:hypothetical protein